MSEIDLREMGRVAVEAGRRLALTTTEARNAALHGIARRLDEVDDALWRANEADLAEAREAGLSAALLDRSTLNPQRVAAMAQGCRDVATLPDPLGEVLDGRALPNGLRIAKRRVPLGVVAAIFEARPNVTADIGALCLKTGNATILRGGKECLRTNRHLVELIRAACSEAGLPADAVQLLASTDRALVPQLLRMDDVIDLVIPRGAQGLQDLVRQHARMPVVYGGIGVCHLYVDAGADLERAVAVIYNAKTQAPSVCNALDTVLAHRSVLARLMPAMLTDLTAAGVRVLCDPPSLAAAGGAGGDLVAEATADDYGREFLSLTLSVKTVDHLDEAIAHIARYSTQHSDGILTDTLAHAQRFVDAVDSAAVFVNASTRFNDGGQFGLGAEVAISTQRLHARGPMSLRELTTYKWIVEGDYHVRR